VDSYKYGRDRVPFSAVDKRVLQFETERVLQVRAPLAFASTTKCSTVSQWKQRRRDRPGARRGAGAAMPDLPIRW
jgi:hypothetical protein